MEHTITVYLETSVADAEQNVPAARAYFDAHPTEGLRIEVAPVFVLSDAERKSQELYADACRAISYVIEKRGIRRAKNILSQFGAKDVWGVPEHQLLDIITACHAL